MKIRILKERTENIFSFYEINKNNEISGNYINKDNGVASIIEINITFNKYSDEENTFSMKLKIDSDEDLKKSINRMNKILKDFKINIKLPYPKENK